MARTRTHVPLGVFVNGRRVGRLRKETSGSIDFQYDGSWLEWEHTFPISLSLPLREDRYVGSSVVAVFDNLLPDGDTIRRRLAERVRAGGDDAYCLLTAIGRDCVGALQFLPGDEEPEAGKLSTINVSPLFSLIWFALRLDCRRKMKNFVFRSLAHKRRPRSFIGKTIGASLMAARRPRTF
jgi:HipA-like protein